jgi:predicted TIM-barrel fold metal-dependent hydrolase
MSRIFDVHVHYPAGSVMGIADRLNQRLGAGDDPSERERRTAVEAVVAQCEEAGIAKACLLGGWGRTNDWVLEAVAEYPDLFVPMAFLDLDAESAEGVGRLADRGFRGVKVILPRKNYDHPEYLPLYAELCERRMPILFHTGVFGGMEDYLERDPKRPSEASALWDERLSRIGTSSARMRAIYLDGIAAAFPELRIIGAHLGYGEYELACAVARWRRNVYFDLSGGDVVRRHIKEKRLIGIDISHRKLMWGSDCVTPRIALESRIWKAQLAEAGLGPDEIEAVLWSNAAWMFGL